MRRRLACPACLQRGAPPPFDSTAFKDKAFLDEYIDEWPTGEIEAELMNGHVYQLKLDARASSSTVGLSSLIVDFWGSDPEEHIKWFYCSVKWI